MKLMEELSSTGIPRRQSGLDFTGLLQTFAPYLVCLFFDFTEHLAYSLHQIASSVDVERAFSGGRRQVGFMQTNMSHDTLKASMALGSWCTGAPFYDVHKGISAVESAMMRGESSGSL